MAQLNFTIPKKLHNQLTSIYRNLGYAKRRHDFYTDCLLVGALQLMKDADANMIKDYSQQIAAEIIEKTEKLEGENYFAIELQIGQYEVFCEGTLDLTYREIYPETRDSEAEFKLLTVGLTLIEDDPSIYLNGVKIDHPITWNHIEDEVTRQLN